MSLTFTIIDSSDTVNTSDGLKHIRGTFSFTNPYTAAGESLSLSTYFPNKFLGGQVLQINPSVTLALTTNMALGKFRGDTTSTTTAVFQMFNVGLSATASAGLLVDNTTANISGSTCTVELWGY